MRMVFCLTVTLSAPTSHTPEPLGIKVSKPPPGASKFTWLFLWTLLFSTNMLEEVLTESGYFDQGHFIKEVRDFSSKTPDDFFNVTPLPTEKFIAAVE